MNYLNISNKEYRIKVKEHLKYALESHLPNIAVNTVIFSFHEKRLNILLLKFADTPHFMLPGGLVMKDEDIDDAAMRNLKDRTDLENIYLEQFYTTGKAKYNSEDIINVFSKQLGDKMVENWLNQRFIRICYYALVDEDKLKPTTKDLFVNEHKWVDAFEHPKLLFNHNIIVEKAISKLQDDLDKKLVEIGENLMDETFTMGELQKLYEAVFQREFTRTNFQRKMLSLNILERLEKKYSGKSHKAPYLYRFKDI